MPRALALALGLALLSASPALARVEVRAGDASGRSQLVIPLVSTTDGAAPASFDLRLDFDPALLQLNSAAASSDLSAAGKTLDVQSAGAGSLQITIGGSTTGFAGGLLGTLTFDVLGSPPTDTTTSLSFSSAMSADSSGAAQTTVGISSQSIVRDALGDVDDSGVVTAADLQLTINALLSAANPPPDGTDVDGSGTLSAADIQRIVNIVLNLPVLDRLRPTQALIGQSIALLGANFGGDPAGVQVAFNGATAAPAFVRPGQLVVIVPLQAQTGPLSVVRGGASNSEALTVLSQPPPNAPTNLTAQAPASDRVELSWQDGGGNAASFRVERRVGSAAFASVGSVPATMTSFSDSAVAEATSYDYRIVATNSSGDSPPSNIASVTTPAAPIISSVTPARAAPTGGAVVLIQGQNFLDGQLVRIGGDAPARVQLLSATSILAEVPAADPSEAGQSVTVEVGSASEGGLFAYDADALGPGVITTIPEVFDINVPRNTGIAFKLSEAIDPATAPNPQTSNLDFTVLLNENNTLLAGTSALSADGTWVVLRPNTPFNAVSSPQVVQGFLIGGTNGIRDRFGNTLTGTNGNFQPSGPPFFRASFGTSAQSDLSPPVLVASAPAAGATDAPLGGVISLVFDGFLDPSSPQPTNLRLMPAGGPAVDLDILVPSDGRSLELRPRAPLQPATSYTLTLDSGGLTDLSGNALTADLNLSFQTRSPAQAFTITAVNPPRGLPQGRAEVIIEGEGFTAFSQVSFAGRRSPRTVTLSGSRLLVEVPPSASLGAVDIAVTRADGLTTSQANAFTYVDDLSVQGDDPRPELLFAFPLTDDQGGGAVPSNGALAFVLSEPLDPATVTYGFTGAVSIVVGGFTTTGTVEVAPDSDNRIIILSPTLSFSGDPFAFLFGFNDPSGAGLRDVNGNRLLDGHTQALSGISPPDFGTVFAWSVTGPDTSGPALTSQSPAASASIGPREVFRMSFSEEIDPRTVSSSLTISDGNGAVPGSIAFDLTTLRGFTFTPSRDLVGTVSVNPTGITDLAGNATSASAFTVTVGADVTAPAVTFLTLNDIPSFLNGAAANGGGAPSNTGRLQVPPTGFTIDFEWREVGAAGVDLNPSSVSLTCDLAVAGNPPGTDLIPLMPPGAVILREGEGHILVPAGLSFPENQVATISVTLRDRAANASAPVSFTFGVFPARADVLVLEGQPDEWTLVLERDFDTHDFSQQGAYILSSPSQGILDLDPDGELDFDADLRGYGMASAAGAATQVNGSSGLTVNEAARNWVGNRIAYHTARLYGIPVSFSDGRPNPGFAALRAFPERPERGQIQLRFLAQASDPGFGRSRIAFGGFSNGNALGRADFDEQNALRNHDNGATAANLDTGVFVGETLRSQYDGSPSNPLGLFRSLFDALSPFSGGTGGSAPAARGLPLGESADDPFILSPEADPASFTGARLSRYQEALRAMDGLALRVASTTAHEVGHSLGLIEDGPPSAGLYGNDASFPGSTSSHIELAGRFSGRASNIMAPASGLETDLSPFSRFNRLAEAYLRNQLTTDPNNP